MYSDSVPSSPKPWIKVGYTKKDSREGLREGTRHEIHLENDGMGGKRKALRDELASRDQMPAVTGIYVWTCRWQRELKHLLPRTSEIIGTVRNFPEYLGWRRIQLLHSKNKKKKRKKERKTERKKEGRKERRKEKKKEKKKKEKKKGRAWGLLDNIFPSCL